MLKGKGYYIWNIWNTEGGNIQKIVSLAQEAGLSHALVKIADGISTFNISSSGVDYARVLTAALQSVGIEVWGWQYIYGNSPSLEASVAVRRIQQTGVSGFVVNAEKEMKGKASAAVSYMNTLRANTQVPLGLSSYRWPSYHPDFPFVEFLSRVDVNLPQVYWLLAHNPTYQLTRTLEEFSNAKFPQVPIIPTGAAFVEYGWSPSSEEVVAFLVKAQSSCEGANFWVWENTRKNLPNIWEVIKSHDWANPPIPDPEPLPEVVAPKVTVLVDTLNVRSGPGTEYRVVRKVYRGEELPVTDVIGVTWVEIEPGQWVAVTLGGARYTELEIK